MPPVKRADPYGAHNFEVSIIGVADDGKAVSGSFTEVSGLEVTIDPIEYRNGSEDITPRKIQGLKKFTNLTLKKGITGDTEFWDWIVEGMNGKPRRVEGTITLLDEARLPVLQWKFKRGWPCKYSGPGLNGTSNEIAMDTVEICHEGLAIDGDGQQG